MEESLSSEVELWENSNVDVNTAITASATGGKGKRKRSTNDPFHLNAFTFMKIHVRNSFNLLSFLNTLGYLPFALAPGLNCLIFN